MINIPLSRWFFPTLGGLLMIGAGNGYYSYRLTRQSDVLQATVREQGMAIEKLAHNLSEAREVNTDLQGEVAFTKQRLGTTQVELRKAQQSSVQVARLQKQWSSQLGQIKQQQETTQGTLGNLSTDVAGVKDGLSSTKQQLDSTQSDLQRTMGDLGIQSGLIARNHDEIAELRLRGERDYYEFDLAKSKQPQRLGDLSIVLKKADEKRERYSINLIADDHAIEKKDKTLNEPVQFYQSGYRQPTEIVVNKISKDRIVGYIAVPKRREGRTAASDKNLDGFRPQS